MSFRIGYATLEDADLLAKHRVLMWKDIWEDDIDKASIQRIEEGTREWIRKKLAKGEVIGLIAKTKEGQVAGSGCIWLREIPPVPFSDRPEIPYLMSMYTEFGFRRKGVAKKIVEFAIDWCRKRGYSRLNLDASDEGRKLYEKLGFKPGFSMRLEF